MQAVLPREPRVRGARRDLTALDLSVDVTHLDHLSLIGAEVLRTVS